MSSIPRILLLEDSPLDEGLVRARFKNDGFDCELVVVREKREFESAVAEGQLDLILSDYRLPDFDGLAALKFARQIRPDVPFIFFSGTIGEARAVECLQLGAVDCILKSHPTRLASAIRRALEQADEHRRREMAERSLRESEGNLARAQSMAHIGSWERNLLNNAVQWSDEQYRIFGYAPQSVQVTFDLFLQSLHPEDWERVCEALKTAADRGKNHNLEFRIIRPDGSIRVLEATGEVACNAEGMPVKAVGIVMDVTERKLAEKSLRETREQLQTIYDSAPLGIIGFDPDGIVVSWNKGAERLFGWSETEVLDGLCPAVDQSDHEEFLEIVRRVSQGETMTRLLWRCLKKTGTFIQASITASALNRGDRKPIGALVIVEDVTAQVQAEKQALRSQRLEAIGTLASGVAHDLNNALAPIMMGVEILRMQYPKDSNIVDMFESSARRGAEMVRQLLTFAKGAEGERVSIQPGHLLKEMHSMMRGSFPKNIQLLVKSEQRLPTVSGDATQLHQILLNLCVNARDAMPNGGMLTLEAQCKEVDPAYASSMPDAKPGRYVTIAVQDTGAGIPPKILDRIFEPFFTTKAPDKGTGLGLSTVMGIVKGHGGFLQVYSQVGQGSKFVVYLPTDRPGSDADFVAEPQITFRGQGETILLLDDEAAVRDVARAVLRRLNFKPLIASDGADGLIQAAEHRTDLRAIITDMHMPFMDGLDFIRVVRRMLPDLPIVVSSGRMEEKEMAEFKAMGVNETLDKPFTEAQMAEVLKKILSLK